MKGDEVKKKRYLSLYHALKDYDRGEISFLWRIKKSLGLLTYL
jgi:hypothetical protein